MEIFSAKFGILWFDHWITKSLEDDSMGEYFNIVSDAMGPFVSGHYDSRIKQCALYSLLGPAFVGKHIVGANKADIRILENLTEEDIEKNLTQYTATFSKIKNDLDNLSMAAWNNVTKTKGTAYQPKRLLNQTAN